MLITISLPSVASAPIVCECIFCMICTKTKDPYRHNVHTHDVIHAGMG